MSAQHSVLELDCLYSMKHENFWYDVIRTRVWLKWLGEQKSPTFLRLSLLLHWNMRELILLFSSFLSILYLTLHLIVFFFVYLSFIIIVENLISLTQYNKAISTAEWLDDHRRGKWRRVHCNHVYLRVIWIFLLFVNCNAQTHYWSIWSIYQRKHPVAIWIPKCYGRIFSLNSFPKNSKNCDTIILTNGKTLTNPYRDNDSTIVTNALKKKDSNGPVIFKCTI